MQDTHITLAHGNGGRFMRELIEEIFAPHLSNPLLDVQADAVALPAIDGELMFTTDGFTVQPLEFPGGDIGSLAVHGTVNDLAVAGAIPLYLSLNVFIEEGLEVAQLKRVVKSLSKTARDCGVQVVAGDTKVVRRGEGGGLYLASTGVGVKDKTLHLGLRRIKSGDAILVSGPVGDHGIAVMLAREQFGYPQRRTLALTASGTVAARYDANNPPLVHRPAAALATTSFDEHGDGKHVRPGH